MPHKIADMVYSNSYGLGFIAKIQQDLISGTDRYYIDWFHSSQGSEYSRWYSDKGIDTLKMFLRIKKRGGDI